MEEVNLFGGSPDDANQLVKDRPRISETAILTFGEFIVVGYNNRVASSPKDGSVLGMWVTTEQLNVRVCVSCYNITGYITVAEKDTAATRLASYSIGSCISRYQKSPVLART